MSESLVRAKKVIAWSEELKKLNKGELLVEAMRVLQDPREQESFLPQLIAEIETWHAYFDAQVANKAAWEKVSATAYPDGWVDPKLQGAQTNQEDLDRAIATSERFEELLERVRTLRGA